MSYCCLPCCRITCCCCCCCCWRLVTLVTHLSHCVGARPGLCLQQSRPARSATCSVSCSASVSTPTTVVWRSSMSTHTSTSYRTLLVQVGLDFSKGSACCLCWPCGWDTAGCRTTAAAGTAALQLLASTLVMAQLELVSGDAVGSQAAM